MDPSDIASTPPATVNGTTLTGSGDGGPATGAENKIVGSQRALLAWSGLVAVQTLVNFGGPLLWPAPEDRIYTYSNAALALLQFGVILVGVLMIARPGGLRETEPPWV